jgi:hypothetical protein
MRLDSAQVGALVINRRFVEVAVWCREIAIPVAVLAVLVAASSPVNDVYSLAAADVSPDGGLTPVTADPTPTAPNVPLSSETLSHETLSSETLSSEPAVSEPVVSEPVTTATATPAAAQEAVEVPVVNAPVSNAPVVNGPAATGPVLAALETRAEELPKEISRPSPDTTPPPNNVAGPKTDEVYDAVSSIEIHDECLVMEMCADRFLWQLYERTKKEDSIRETTYRKVTIKKKRKWITVTRASTIVVNEDFGWKDPKAAKNVSMSLADYVIGGVDRDFRLRLFSMLRAAELAGLSPGITSAFRDDYRQSIASGLKAASNRSYHGGSLRGGYGHGLAADIVSVKGATRGERLANSNILWKWVDDHGIEFGIGRPYLDRDPPHVGPIDGEEFAHHRPGAKTRQAAAAAN